MKVPFIYLTHENADGEAGLSQGNPPQPYAVCAGSSLVGVTDALGLIARPADRLLPLGLCAVAVKGSDLVDTKVFVARVGKDGLPFADGRGGVVVLAQTNPVAVLIVDESQITALHRVVWSDQPELDFVDSLAPILDAVPMGEIAEPINTRWSPSACKGGAGYAVH